MIAIFREDFMGQWTVNAEESCACYPKWVKTPFCVGGNLSKLDTAEWKAKTYRERILSAEKRMTLSETNARCISSFRNSPSMLLNFINV